MAKLSSLLAVSGFMAILVFPAIAGAQSAQPVLMFQGTVLLPDGKAASFRVREGDLLLIGTDEDNTWQGLLPTSLRGVRRDLVPFTVKGTRGEWDLSQIEIGREVQALQGVLFARGKFNVRIDRIYRCSSPSSSFLAKDFGDSDFGSCCVSCDGVTICGGSVSTSCGSCGTPGGGHLAM